VVSLAYPLAPEHPFPQPIEVGYAVLQWLYKHRVKMAGKGAPLFLAGEEAGGNLAAAVAVISRDRGHPPLAGQILVSPMLDPCTGTASQREATPEAGVQASSHVLPSASNWPQALSEAQACTACSAAVYQHVHDFLEAAMNKPAAPG
jgi:acetyl esterase/lipase